MYSLLQIATNFYYANCYRAQSNHFTFIVHKQLNYLLGPLFINNYIFSTLHE